MAHFKSFSKSFRFDSSKFLLIYCLLICCKGRDNVVESTFNPIRPNYENIQLVALEDTLNFNLPEHTSNRVECFNLFRHDTAEFIAFYDKGAKCLLIYNFHSGELKVQKYLRQWVKSDKLDKATIYVKNFDTICVATRSKFFLLDSAGTTKCKIEFSEKSGNSPFISNTVPIIFNKGLVFMGVKPLSNEKSIAAQRKFKVLYGLDIKNKEKNRFYNLPSIYKENLYGYSFNEYGYCINNKGNFVFSFAADTNIYETNFSDYHMAYFGRSKFQSTPITPITKEELEKGASYRSYSLKDSYEAIFFDPYRKRYIRQVKHKMTETEFESRSAGKKRSAIIFDEHFQIIGESEVKGQYSIESIFFTKDCKIYARTNGTDKKSLHFIQLRYLERNRDTNSVQLAHQSIKTK